MRMLSDDIVRVIDQDGTTRGQIGAVVDKNTIITDDASLLIKDGDKIERDLPHGRKETLLATHVQFHRGSRGIPAFYEITTETPNSLSNQPSEPGVSVYVTDSPYTRVNLNSVDSSNNVVGIRANEVFQRTRHLLETGVEDNRERSVLLQSVNEMEEAHQTQDFVAKYKDFMGLAANHITVLAPIVPALASLL